MLSSQGNISLVNSSWPVVGEKPSKETSTPISEDIDQGDITKRNDRLFAHNYVKSLLSLKKTNFPIILSTFNALNNKNTDEEMKVDIKETSYKKISNLIEKLEKDGVIVTKTLKPGVTSIMSFDRDCEATKSHLAAVSDDEEETLYIANELVAPIFAKYIVRRDTPMDVKSIIRYLTDYLHENRLTKKGIVFISRDKVLLELLPKEANVKEIILEDALMLVMNNMKVMDINSGKPNRPSKKTIDFRIKTIKGNKKVTVVSSLTSHGIDMGDFSRECQKAVGANATLNADGSLKIQGNQIKQLQRLLHGKYEVPLKYFSSTEPTPKKK